MLKLYHAPMTRSIRIYWLLEELGIPYQLSAQEIAALRERGVVA